MYIDAIEYFFSECVCRKNVQQADSEKAVVQVVEDLFSSIINNNNELYTRSVSTRSIDASIEDVEKANKTKILDYEIVKTQQISESKYEVSIKLKTEGKEYPVIPYDVVLQDGVWKFDTTSVTVFPKEDLLKQIKDQGFELLPDGYFMKHVVSENDNFWIVKFDEESINNISTRSFLTYNFGTKSTDIYMNGSIRLEARTDTTDENTFIYYGVYSLDNTFWQAEYSKTTPYGSHDVVISTGHDYYNANVFEMNHGYPLKYNVVW